MARIEASASKEDDMLRRGIDIRYAVTSLETGDAGHILRDRLLRARTSGTDGPSVRDCTL